MKNFTTLVSRRKALFVAILLTTALILGNFLPSSSEAASVRGVTTKYVESGKTPSGRKALKFRVTNTTKDRVITQIQYKIDYRKGNRNMGTELEGNDYHQLSVPIMPGKAIIFSYPTDERANASLSGIKLTIKKYKFRTLAN